MKCIRKVRELSQQTIRYNEIRVNTKSGTDMQSKIPMLVIKDETTRMSREGPRETSEKG